MNDWVYTLLNSDYGVPSTGGTWAVVFVMLFTFAVGHFIGFVYMWTHEAISYSRTFVASLAVLPMLIALMMLVMAGSLLFAFGLLAVFGVIRFRNVLKDTRDTTFVIWAIMEGLMIGTMRYSTALIGVVGLAGAFFYLRLTSFGTRHRYDAMLTLRLNGAPAVAAQLKKYLSRHALSATLLSERRANEGAVDMTYRLLLRDPGRFYELEAALTQVQGVENVSVFLHEDDAEI
jgi:hypothetical protein